eukprot:COSAG02_NODE_562_length_20293_cov_37.104288_3_plen_158_part_00
MLNQLIPVVCESPQTNLEEVACEGQRTLVSVLCEGILKLLREHRPVQARLDMMNDVVPVIKGLLILEVVDTVVPAIQSILSPVTERLLERTYCFYQMSGAHSREAVVAGVGGATLCNLWVNVNVLGPVTEHECHGCDRHRHHEYPERRRCRHERTED